MKILRLKTMISIQGAEPVGTLRPIHPGFRRPSRQGRPPATMVDHYSPENRHFPFPTNNQFKSSFFTTESSFFRPVAWPSERPTPPPVTETHHCLPENLHCLLKNLHFLLKNLHFLLKNLHLCTCIKRTGATSKRTPGSSTLRFCGSHCSRSPLHRYHRFQSKNLPFLLKNH